ncbi:outer membrane protein [Legionella feeleii]|uniref:Opacity protein and related surface antigens n=1 Tax=Legionella feeleii TaxID=453 RepID=A0A378KK22_9GAMM|nr:opacity family porin [Legionella feeleii]STX88285.1 Opacity protein and related surface antigens [Legionella feeleii]
MISRLVALQSSIFLWGAYSYCAAASSHASHPLIDKDGLSTNHAGYVFTLSAGPVWTQTPDTETFYLEPEVLRSYVPDNDRDTLAVGELFLGIQRPLYKTINGQIGLAFATTGNANFSGYIWESADPQFNNYVYGYRIQHSHIAIKGKLLTEGRVYLDKEYAFQPWIDASVGLGLNQARRYYSTPIIPEALPTPGFSSNSKASFTYTVGAGLQKELTSNWQIGIGYQFADWGKSRFGRAAGQSMNNGLTLNHVYTNGVLFNLTYLS